MRNLLLMLCMAVVLPLGMGCSIDDGADGTTGAAGETGAAGANGSDGDDGTNAAGGVELSLGECAVDLSATSPYDLFVCCSAGGTAQAFEGEDGETEEGSVLLFDIECFSDSDGRRCRGSSECGDGVRDSEDNCPKRWNPSQDDLDNDGVGDACDGDADGDDIADEVDMCEGEEGTAISFACDDERGFEGFTCETDVVQAACDNGEEDCENNDCADSSGLLHQWLPVDCSRHGCDDTDSDNDGVRDLDDTCPNSAVDADVNNRGCADNDDDGLDNAADECPEEAEDFDGLLDDDGCPEQDADGDGVEDHADQCSMIPEDLDGFEDADGCPEEGGTPLPVE